MKIFFPPKPSDASKMNLSENMMLTFEFSSYHLVLNLRWSKDGRQKCIWLCRICYSIYIYSTNARSSKTPCMFSYFLKFKFRSRQFVSLAVEGWHLKIKVMISFPNLHIRNLFNIFRYKITLQFK